MKGATRGAGGVVERRLAAARFVADHWREAMLRHEDTSWAAHPLCMVLAALDGATDPAECGINPDAYDGFHAAVGSTLEEP